MSGRQFSVKSMPTLGLGRARVDCLAAMVGVVAIPAVPLKGRLGRIWRWRGRLGLGIWFRPSHGPGLWAVMGGHCLVFLYEISHGVPRPGKWDIV